MQLEGNWECFCLLSISQSHSDIPGVWSKVAACSTPLPSCWEVAPHWWPCSADVLDAVWQRGWASFPSIGRVLWFRGYEEAPPAAAYAMCRLGVNGSCCSGTLELTAFVKASVLRCLKSAANSWCWHQMKRPVSSLLSAAVNAVPANSKPLKIHFVLVHKALKSEWF